MKSHLNEEMFGLILAGGKSLRMGQDKTLLEYKKGKPQIEVVHDLLSQFCSRVFLSKRADQKGYKNLEVLDDHSDFKDMGPLGGIASAMQAWPNAAFLVLACDLPYVDEQALKFLIDHRQKSAFASAFISVTEDLPEPLCAIWEPHHLEEIKTFMSQGIRCPRKVLIKSNTHLIQQPNPKWLTNINTPEEYKKVGTDTTFQTK